MKSIHVVLLIIFSYSATAQGRDLEKKQASDTGIYSTVEVSPYPTFDLTHFLLNNLQYPESARDNKVEGRLKAQFVVEKDGSLTNITFLRGAEWQNGLPEEVIRVIKLMPKWNPGMQNGVPVRVYHTLPFTFRLQ